MNLQIRTYSGGGGELPVFRIGDKVLLSHPDPEEAAAVAQGIDAIMKNTTLGEEEAAAALAETIANASLHGTLVARSDTHVTVSNLQTRGGEEIEPSTQTFEMNEIIACLQRRRVDDQE